MKNSLAFHIKHTNCATIDFHHSTWTVQISCHLSLTAQIANLC